MKDLAELKQEIIKYGKLAGEKILPREFPVIYQQDTVKTF